MVVCQKTPEGTSSAILFGVRTVAKCCELKQCPTEFAAEHNKDEVLKGNFCNLNFLPSTKKATEYNFF